MKQTLTVVVVLLLAVACTVVIVIGIAGTPKKTADDEIAQPVSSRTVKAASVPESTVTTVTESAGESGSLWLEKEREREGVRGGSILRLTTATCPPFPSPRD